MSYLFDKSLVPQVVKGSLFRGFEMRPIKSDDYERGALKVLSVLTTVGDISKEQFQAQFDYWYKHNDTYFTLVITGPGDKVVAIGTVFVERKLIHTCGKVGHIEDIAVSKDHQGFKLGKKLIDALVAIGKSQGCYKVILDCEEKNVKFYEKCGFYRHGVEMVTRFDSPPPKL